MFESDETVEDKKIAPFQLSVRIIYLFLVVAVILGNLYVFAFPGSTKDERFERFMIWGLSMYLSAFISAPALLFLLWKLIKGETSTFWTIAFLIAAFPIWEMVLIVIWGLIVG